MKIVGTTGLGSLWALELAWQTFLGQSTGMNETNSFQLKCFFSIKNCGHHRFARFVGFKVGVAYARNKLALRTRPRNLNKKFKFSIIDSFRDKRVHINVFF